MAFCRRTKASRGTLARARRGEQSSSTSPKLGPKQEVQATYRPLRPARTWPYNSSFCRFGHADVSRNTADNRSEGQDMAEYTVDAVDKALGLLFLVAQYPGLGVTELAKRSGNTKARAYRLLGTLEQGGLVRRETGSSAYTLGYKALVLGAAAGKQLNLPRLAAPHLEAIGAKCNETVLVRIRDGLETISVARWESTHAVRIHAEIGNRRPLYVGASGKLLLAHAPADIQQLVLGGQLEKFTPSTYASEAKLKKELARIQVQGYSTSFGERTTGTVSAAAPVRDAAGEVVAALSITGPSSRVSQENIDEYVDLVVEGARRLSRDLGWIE